MLLKEKYNKIILPEFKAKFNIKNDLAVPRVLKIVVNIGAGRVKDDKQAIQDILKILSLITGQKPSPRPSRKAISSFKTRIGLIVGYKVTLRSKRMSDFLEKLINFTLPRVRDFRGLDLNSIDKGGNLTLGFKEHLAFPETIGEDFKGIYGLEITIVTNAKSREEAIEFFKLLGFPFKS